MGKRGELTQSPYRQLSPLGSHLGNAFGQLFRANKIKLSKDAFTLPGKSDPIPRYILRCVSGLIQKWK